MTDADALLAAIDADPAAELPRLVWADYLDDRGHPAAAEFVRVSVAAGRLVRRPAGDQAKLNARRREAWRRYADEYAVALEQAGLAEPAFGRGLPGAVEVTAQRFLDRAAGWWPAVPVRAVRLSKLRDDHAHPLAASAAVARLTELALGVSPSPYNVLTIGQVPAIVVRQLATADLPRLRRLTIGRVADPTGVLTWLADSGWAGRLPGDAVTVFVSKVRRTADGSPVRYPSGEVMMADTPLTGGPDESAAVALRRERDRLVQS